MAERMTPQKVAFQELKNSKEQTQNSKTEKKVKSMAEFEVDFIKELNEIEKEVCSVRDLENIKKIAK